MINSTHSCQAQQHLSLCIYFDDERGNWILQFNHEVTAENLENYPHLETIGDIIAIGILTIQYCPYCGERLNNKKVTPDYQHIDLSHW